MGSSLRYDYLAIGHVTVDEMPDGSRRPGGTVLYSALQASRLGLRAAILTRGVPGEVERLLEPYGTELDLLVQPAAETTMLATSGAGSERTQRMLAWAGPIERMEVPDSAIVHLAPVAAELGWCPPGDGAFVGLTAQGLVRGWSGPGAEVLPSAPRPEHMAIARGCDALVISDGEREICEAMLAAARSQGAIVAVTAGPASSEILLADGQALDIAVLPIDRPADDLGAGDVYASALFVALAAGEQPRAAGEMANAAAAIRMLGVGPDAIAGREAIEQRTVAGRRATES
jgi:sugar/nucleoside kinase (ribokinase family)